MDDRQVEKYEAIKAELGSLRIKLRSEEQGLANLTPKYDGLCITAADGDAEAAAEAVAIHSRAERIKVVIFGLKIKIGKCETEKAAFDAIVGAECDRQRQEDAKAKWEGLVVQARNARAKLLRLKREVPAFTRKAEDAQSLFEHARAALDEHRSTPIDPLGLSPTVLARARELDAELLDARNIAMRQRDHANTVAGQHRTAVLIAAQECDQAATVERLNRPREIAKSKAPATVGEALQAR